MSNEFKRCNTCKETKSIIEFATAKGNTEGTSHRCKKCDLVYQREYRKKNRDKIQETVTKKRNDRKDLCIERLGGKCDMCQGVFHRECYDFHHTDPSTKLFGVGERWNRHSLAKILTEVDKCRLLCSNCHRILHYTGE